MANKVIDIKGLGAEALEQKLTELESELKTMTFEHAIKGIANPIQIRDTRKNVARIKTAQRAIEIDALSADDLKKRDRIRLRRK